MNNLQVAVVRIERFLEDRHPNFRTLTIQQAKEAFGFRTYDIWCAWTLLAASITENQS